ncbi:MAG: hypothetical protein IPG64_13730 [Haliea sp.]|nr:hypothetical protein [Haliea sp.]
MMELIGEHCEDGARLPRAHARLFGIEGDDTTAISKLPQLDHHFMPEYVRTGVQLIDEQHGRF